MREVRDALAACEVAEPWGLEDARRFWSVTQPAMLDELSRVTAPVTG
jgi:hypothetical protein